MKGIFSRISFLLFFILLLSTKTYSQAPVANFNSPDPTGCSPYPVAFTDNSTNGPTTWDWDFGDPNAPTHAFIQNPQHIYQDPGTYTVTLTVTNASGANTIIKVGFVRIYKVPTVEFTMSEDTVCPGTAITFTDASIPGDTIINAYEWIFNDGSSHAFTNPVVHSFPNTGSAINYYVPIYTVTDAFGCSSTTATDTVYILPIPNASFIVNSTSCTFPASVTFNNTSTQPQVFSWDFGDPSSGANNFSTQTNPTHSYAAQGNYSVTLTNGVTGCNAQITMPVDLIPPVAAFTAPPKACAGSLVQFINNSTPTTGTTYIWNFGDNTTSTAVDPVHTYGVPSTYTVKLITFFGTCSDTITHQILIPLRPVAKIHVNDSTSCNVPFTPNFTDPDPAHVSWGWNFGDPAAGGADTSTQQSPSYTYTAFGTYTPSLIITDTNGCIVFVVDTDLIVIAPPVISVAQDPDSGCLGSTFNYTASVSSPADPNVLTWTWNFGDGTGDFTQATPAISHQFNTVGIFDVTVIVTTVTGCSDTLTLPAFAKIGTRPVATIKQVLDTICFQESITFTDLTPQPVTGWHWYFGDGGEDPIEQNPTHIYQQDTSGIADPFDIVLIAYYNGCADTDTVVNMIAVLSPIPYFSTIVDCANEDSVIFTNLTTGGNTYVWDFGDASATNTDTNTVHVFAGRGSYFVTLTATNVSNTCVVDTIIQVNVLNIHAEITTDTLECYPYPIPFSSQFSTDADSLWWNFGDPVSGPLNLLGQAQPFFDTLHLYNQNGTYTVTLIAKDANQCYDTTTARVHMRGPFAGFTMTPSTGCLNPVTGFTVNFADTSHSDGGAIVGWSWNYGTGSGWTPPTTANTSHNYTAANLYTVSLAVVDVNGCVDTAVYAGGVNPTAPSAIITNSSIGCRNVAKQFAGSPGPAGSYLPPVHYSWDFGDGHTDTGGVVNHTYPSNGFYTVTLTVTDGNGCSSTSQQVNDIYTTSAHFTTSPTVTCETVNGVKRAKVSVQFTSDSTQHTTQANYDWDFTVFRDSTVDPSRNPYTYDFLVAPGTYDATLTLTNDYGCKDTYTITGAVVVPGPVGTYSFTPDSGCTPLTVNFTGSSPSTSSYVWDFGDGVLTTGSMTSITHTYATPGVYTPQFMLGFQLQNDFCYIPVDTIGTITATSLLSVNIIETSVQIPSVGASVPVNVIVTDPNNIGPPYTYVWNPASQVTQGSNSNEFNITSEEDSSVFMLSIPYGNGCSGIDYVTVFGAPCEFNWDSIPNVFTPGDNNSQNDNYHIKDLCPNENFFIKIFNRWGRLIYESNDPQFKWDGTTTSGTEASEGTYYYVLSARKKDHHGYIELIRPHQ